MKDATPEQAMDLSQLEKPVLELEAQIRAMEMDPSQTKEREKLEKKLDKLKADLFTNLTDWQRAQLARHPKRPYTLDYLERICERFEELHGDRRFGDDAAIVAGMGWIEGNPVMVIGQQKGRDTKEKILRNFGMPKPEGYRKALRLMKLAEKFQRPVLRLIDTPGAYPGVDAEERGQAEAIARNLLEMASSKCPSSPWSSARAAAAGPWASAWPTACSCWSTPSTPSSRPRAAPPSCGRTPARPRRPPRPSSSPPRTCWSWASSTASSRSPWAAPTPNFDAAAACPEGSRRGGLLRAVRADRRAAGGGAVPEVRPHGQCRLT